MVEAINTFDFEAVWDDLVAQFSEPLSCLRELVQNAIDAESGEVEVWITFEAGRMVLHVRDWGVGMDREVIEGRLTDLFDSGKAEDYTKIGRFGIGFVSVFALEPTVVCVDTGRSGKYWRVLFHDDGRFELLSRDRPIEGTHIRIVKQVDASEVDGWRERARQVLGYWCRHASIPVRFEDEDVRTPFEVEAPCAVTYREEGTRIVAGLVESPEAPYGYYNRGLTLEQGDQGPKPHVAFKIDSRYLEHTLTRDQVVENEDYHKAHDRLETLVETDLPSQLIADLEASAASSPDRHDRLASLVSCYLGEYGELIDGWRERPLFGTVSGEAASVAECREASDGNELFVYTGDEPIGAGAFGDGTVVVRAGGDGRGVSELLARLTGGRVPALRSRYAIPRIRTVSDQPGAAATLEAFERLLDEIGIEVERVGLGDFFDESPLVERPVVVADGFDTPLPIDDLPDPARANLVEHDVCLINLDHGIADPLSTVAEREPEWAALSLVKLICGADLRPDEDARMVETVQQRRRRRKEER